MSTDARGRTALDRLRQRMVDYKIGTQSRTDCDDCEVETIRKTLNVVIAEIDSELARVVLASPQGWEPIESCPKNRRHYLTYVPDEFGDWVIQIAYWDDDFWHFIADEGESHSRAHQPTHWMPLPAPPVSVIPPERQKEEQP